MSTHLPQSVLLQSPSQRTDQPGNTPTARKDGNISYRVASSHKRAAAYERTITRPSEKLPAPETCMISPISKLRAIQATPILKAPTGASRSTASNALFKRLREISRQRCNAPTTPHLLPHPARRPPERCNRPSAQRFEKTPSAPPTPARKRRDLQNSKRKGVLHLASRRHARFARRRMYTTGKRSALARGPPLQISSNSQLQRNRNGFRRQNL